MLKFAWPGQETGNQFGVTLVGQICCTFSITNISLLLEHCVVHMHTYKLHSHIKSARDCEGEFGPAVIIETLINMSWSAVH